MNIRDDRKKVFTVIGFSFFIGYLIISTTIVWNLTCNLTINGTIQKIKYEEPKHIAYPTINGKEYDLYYSGSGTGDTLSIGDIIIKEKGTMNYKLIKNKIKLRKSSF